MNKNASSKSIWLIVAFIIALMFIILNTAIGQKAVDIFIKNTDCESNFGHTCLAFCGGDLQRSPFSCPDETDTCCRDPDKIKEYCESTEDCDEEETCYIELNVCKGSCETPEQIAACKNVNKVCDNGACVTEAEREVAQEKREKVIEDNKHSFYVSTVRDFTDKIQSDTSRYSELQVGTQYKLYFALKDHDGAGACVASVLHGVKGVDRKAEQRTYYSQQQCASLAEYSFRLTEAHKAKSNLEIQIVFFDKKCGTTAAAVQSSSSKCKEPFNNLISFNGADAWSRKFTIVEVSPEGVEKEPEEKPVEPKMEVYPNKVTGTTPLINGASYTIPASSALEFYMVTAHPDMQSCYIEIAKPILGSSYEPIEKKSFTKAECEAGIDFPFTFSSVYTDAILYPHLRLRALASDKVIPTADDDIRAYLAQEEFLHEFTYTFRVVPAATT